MRTFAILACCSLLGTVPATAQSLSGAQIGDRIGSAPIFKQKPLISTRSGPFNIQKWRLEDSNDLSVTSNASDGRIVYAETDWNGQTSGAISDFGGFTYGKTSLAEIENKFGSTGIIFRNHLSAKTANGGLARFATYTVTGQRKLLVTFVTMLDKQEAKGYSPDRAVEQHALWKLSAIIIADDDYLSAIWGNQVKIPDDIKEITWVENGPDSQFDARLVCPESMGNEDARDAAFSELAEWAQNSHSDWTLERVLSSYHDMLRNHHCTASVEATRDVKIPEIFNGNWSSSEDKIAVCDFSNDFLLLVTPDNTKAPETFCKPITALKRENGTGYTMRMLCAGEGEVSASREIWDSRIFDGSLVLSTLDISNGGVSIYKQCNAPPKPSPQAQPPATSPKP